MCGRLLVGPKLVYATVRDACEADGGDPELHIECRMSDGQKGAFAVVDAEFPEMAQLFAAAPDLLAACKFALTECCPDDSECPVCGELERVLTAAIEKAHGVQPCEDE